MQLDKFIVTFVDLFAIFFVYWFFLMKKETQVEVTDYVDIIVDGGYVPNTIVIKKEKTTKINFIRKDPTTCLEEVVLGDFKIRRFLPLNKKVTKQQIASAVSNVGYRALVDEEIMSEEELKKEKQKELAQLRNKVIFSLV